MDALCDTPSAASSKALQCVFMDSLAKGDFLFSHMPPEARKQKLAQSVVTGGNGSGSGTNTSN